MKLTDEAWEVCSCCGKRKKMIQEETYGCDTCGQVIDPNKSEDDHLYMSVFRVNQSTEHLHFCSWSCVLKKIPSIKSDYFVTLPYLSYDAKKPGLRAKDFLECIRRGVR